MNAGRLFDLAHQNRIGLQFPPQTLQRDALFKREIVDRRDSDGSGPPTRKIRIGLTISLSTLSSASDTGARTSKPKNSMRLMKAVFTNHVVKQLL